MKRLAIAGLMAGVVAGAAGYGYGQITVTPGGATPGPATEPTMGGGGPSAPLIAPPSPVSPTLAPPTSPLGTPPTGAGMSGTAGTGGTEGASTQPSAQAVLENLLSTTQPAAPRAAPVPPGGKTPNVEIQGAAVAPNQPAVARRPEGYFLWNQVGRLTKDEKTQEWLFVFDSDGKNMKDPPMGVIPSRMLMAMQKASANGTQPTKFRVSGEVTEYDGKNYLYVKDQRIVQDLNQGIGG